MEDFFQPTHLIILLFVFIFFGAILIVPYWQIFKKAGFPAALSLLMVVPVANLVVLYVVAFSPWKVVSTTDYYPRP